MILGGLGIACTIVGLFGAPRPLHLIVLESQGVCGDFGPCATAATYVTAAGFLLIAVIGVAMVAAAALLKLKSRLSP